GAAGAEQAREHATAGAEGVAVQLPGREQSVVVAGPPPAEGEVRTRRALADHQGVAGAVGDVREADAGGGDVEDPVRRAVELDVDVVVRAGNPEVAGHGPVA